MDFSKNLTKAGSLSKEARICSKANDQPSLEELEVGASGSPVWEASEVVGPTVGDVPLWVGEVGLWSFRPTSSILSKRPVTVAMARNRSSSSGSPWNKLYKVLENWMNWDWEGRKKATHSLLSIFAIPLSYLH
uniref:Uncharacterized protein n=1 Tax=Laticauda laticaudata TaxID=8630 RepID=A0A8C5SCC8_LATLA